ncbi:MULTISPECIES: hypothetical protein [Nocardia]|jgi:hypothetical protein|nr:MULTISPECIES: hypothetical protein [Nocardia]
MNRDIGVAGAAAAVSSRGYERERFVDIGQRLPCRDGQCDGDFMSGPVSRGGELGSVTEFGVQFGQLLHTESALLIQGVSECGQMVGKGCA